MAGSAHPEEIDIAFSGNPELRKRVHAAIDQNPKHSTLFRDISTYILNRTSQSVPEPASKKRKLDNSNGNNGVQNGTAKGADTANLLSASTTAWKTYTGVSFSIPQRKKLTLELVSGKGGGVRGIGADGKVEFGIAWKDVDQIFCLPVPEKAKRQHNFIVLPVYGDGVNPLPEDRKDAPPPDPILWTFEEASGKNIIEGEDPGPRPIASAINESVKSAGIRKQVVFPDPEEFVSAIVQSHRKGEKGYHVKAHRGSKEGYLFFTSIGILYGFKKPLLFFDFAAITSISYTNVLRNTFNLVVQSVDQEFEFSMIDQEDYPGITEYVQKHGLQDASMAAARRAQKLNINPPADNENGVAGGADEESELTKAERLLQDEEDEDEEDYEPPASDAESEGSGSDDSDDEDEEDGEDYDEGEEYEEGYEEGEGEGEEMEGHNERY
ncbi:Rtt106-domain-containing protein [Aaosphaeria arxii CBS 175.79]|uniref:Rtt106-domain-containing protein n=1 Tax=Aaosphaeria arxii CBS 175.79 TaxID=1450172 RepID=A0A6A5XZ62_9PLEO|nr:Rtt106-domain-containing protein [Aaosphaeria arxii CBS 175.79]KAF2018249.1 Rtt106-domain-containing protein [Aaosphaeria arxii CBS 175.79]